MSQWQHGSEVKSSMTVRDLIQIIMLKAPNLDSEVNFEMWDEVGADVVPFTLRYTIPSISDNAIFFEIEPQ